jgi:hypothetical protein
MVLGLTLLKGTFFQLVNSLNQLSKNRAEKREALSLSIILAAFV